MCSKRLCLPDHEVSCLLISSKARMDSMLIPALNLFPTGLGRGTLQPHCLTLGILDAYCPSSREVENKK